MRVRPELLVTTHTIPNDELWIVVCWRHVPALTDMSLYRMCLCRHTLFCWQVDNISLNRDMINSNIALIDATARRNKPIPQSSRQVPAIVSWQVIVRVIDDRTTETMISFTSSIIFRCRLQALFTLAYRDENSPFVVEQSNLFKINKLVRATLGADVATSRTSGTVQCVHVDVTTVTYNMNSVAFAC